MTDQPKAADLAETTSSEAVQDAGRELPDEHERQFECLRKEYNAITRLSKQFDEFSTVYDPECELPQLADHVHGIIGGLSAELQQARTELDEVRRENGSLRNEVAETNLRLLKWKKIAGCG